MRNTTHTEPLGGKRPSRQVQRARREWVSVTLQQRERWWIEAKPCWKDWQTECITSGEGQQNRVIDSPHAFCCLVGGAVLSCLFICCHFAGLFGCRGAFHLSRQRHGAGMNQSVFTVTPPLPFAGRARQQKTHAGQNPGTRFFIATRHP